jgi:hypothetical protein
MLLYGAETWACTKKEESKPQAVEIQSLRGIVRKTRRDRNTYIRGELKMKGIHNQTKRSRLRWFGRVKKMNEHRIPERLLEMKMSRSPPQGRPHT